ncbi:hypothetical protein BO85DRAFT_367453 [Aspergillus piperis CBS 112811]|uniref:Uncharacterized protein n=1 Tax=Aspergillus piperis CBS 112811 TaxID=1448313 RepID=A0A8G1R817_9EURO|nr:hypothetical protein BO85DRAFT_367453 [Aspergillus piperis CBS 112811]RAH59939.1 hypothetical protein BO85DRAFT_367453 [Aspergillus piperis CBS 112811]
MASEEPPAFNLTEVDRQVLAQTDEEFVLHDWEDLKSIIARNDLGILKRKPSDLTRYLSWSHKTKQQYGSITNYICQKRLGWTATIPSSPSSSSTTTTPSTSTPTSSITTSTETSTTTSSFPYKNPIPFADPSDYKILRNDWPYGLAPGISHIVVWLRTPVAVKEENGDVTDESRALIEAFVQRTFVDAVVRDEGVSEAEARDRVLWFKNWAALQSVRSLEHVHVLVRDVSERLLVEWTGEEGVTR